MERKLFPGLMALMFFAAPVGCNGPATGDTDDVGNPDDSGDPGDNVTYMVTLHAAIDGVTITDNPPAVCVHETSGETGEEAVLATGTTTEVQIPVDVPEDGVMVRPWVGPSTAAKTADGHRIYERDGFYHIHEIADFLLEEDCEDTVNLNVMPAVENVQYSCTMDQTWMESGEPANHQIGVHTFVAQEGKYFTDLSDPGLSGAIGTNEKLMTTGTILGIHNPDSGNYDGDGSTEIRENGFTLQLANSVVETTLTCTAQ